MTEGPGPVVARLDTTVEPGLGCSGRHDLGRAIVEPAPHMMGGRDTFVGRSAGVAVDDHASLGAFVGRRPRG